MRRGCMKKHKTALFAAIMISVTCFLNGLGCGRPLGLAIHMNPKMAKLIPVLREDAPRIIEKLEILRLGFAKENEYAVYLGGFADSYQLDYQIIITDGYQSSNYRDYNLAERLEEFSAEEIDAMRYLLLSDTLQLNASSIHFGLGAWTPPHAVFASDEWWEMGIYFGPDKPEIVEYYRHRGDYVEKLDAHYWLVMRFVERY